MCGLFLQGHCLHDSLTEAPGWAVYPRVDDEPKEDVGPVA